MCGDQVLYRDFSCGNVLIPVKTAERAAVANALRSVLAMVDGEISLPSFSMVSDCSAVHLQSAPSLADHRAYAAALQTGWSDDQNAETNTTPLRPHRNDNL